MLSTNIPDAAFAAFANGAPITAIIAEVRRAQREKAERDRDYCRARGWHFEIVDLDGRRIDKVLAIPPRVAESEETEPE